MVHRRYFGMVSLRKKTPDQLSTFADAARVTGGQVLVVMLFSVGGVVVLVVSIAFKTIWTKKAKIPPG